MADFPSSAFGFYPMAGAIHSASFTSFLMDADQMNRSGWSSTVSAANRANLIAFYLDTTVTVYQITWENGATVAGNVDVGIYDEGLNRLVSSGSTAQAGVSVSQTVDITDTVLKPGSYFMALATDSATATFWRSLKTGMWATTSGVYQASTSFPLPNPITLDAGTTTIPAAMPAIGLILRPEA